MRNSFFKRLKQKVRVSRVNLVCVFMMAMLTGGCSGDYIKETSLETPAPPSPSEVTVSHANETSQVSEKGESVNGETNDDQEIVCRRIPVTGSRISNKVCATKEQWAFWDKSKRNNAEAYLRDANEASHTNTSDPFGPVAPSPGVEAYMP